MTHTTAFSFSKNQEDATHEETCRCAVGAAFRLAIGGSESAEAPDRAGNFYGENAQVVERYTPTFPST